MSYVNNYAESRPINPPGYIIDKMIDMGSLSTVWLAKRIKDGIDVAIKAVSLKLLTEQTKKLIIREYEILSKLNHPNIIKVFDRIEHAGFIFLVLEYLPGGNLKEKVQRTKGLDEKEASEIFFDILKALSYLHDEVKVVHRDLKAENVVFDKSGSVKLIDFGFATSCNPSEPLKELCGSPRYTAPEILFGEEYSFPVDIWSLGVIVYFMVSNSFPYDGNSIKDVAENIKYGQINIKCECSYELKRLLLSIFVKTPKLRPNASKLMTFKWESSRKRPPLPLKDRMSHRLSLIPPFIKNYDVVGRLCASGRFSRVNSKRESTGGAIDKPFLLSLNRTRSQDFNINKNINLI